MSQYKFKWRFDGIEKFQDMKKGFCSFCGKPADKVKTLIISRKASICDECLVHVTEFANTQPAGELA